MKKYQKINSTEFIPKGRLTKRRLTALVLMLCILFAVLSGTFVYVLANPSPTSTYYAEEGIYPGAPSYTVWRGDSTYYAKDANGHIAYMSSNASYVINSAWQPDARVLLKAGFYSLTARLNAENNSVLEGENPYNTIFYAEDSSFGQIICHHAESGALPPPYGTPVYNLTIKNLGFRANPSDPTDRGIYIRAFNLTVESCIFEGFGGYFIKSVYSGNVDYLFNKGYDGELDGFDFLYVDTGRMIGNEIYRTGDDCIAVVHSNDTVVMANTIFGNYSGAGDGIAVWGNSHDNIISNNIIHDISHCALSAKYYETKNPSNLTFSSNQAYNLGWYGFYSEGTATGNDTISGLTVTDNRFYKMGYSGIRVLMAGYGICTENQIIDAGLGTNNTYHGIVIDYSSGNYSNSWIINNNIIRNTQSPTLTVKYCIFLTGSYHVCIGNIAYGAGTTNIQDSSTGSDVDHNQESGF